MRKLSTATTPVAGLRFPVCQVKASEPSASRGSVDSVDSVEDNLYLVQSYR